MTKEDLIKMRDWAHGQIVLMERAELVAGDLAGTDAAQTVTDAYAVKITERDALKPDAVAEIKR